MNPVQRIYLTLFIFGLITGCKTYKSNVMFRVKDFENDPKIAEQLKQAEKNYRMKVNDKIDLIVETNGGEALIDPNRQMRIEMAGGVGNQGAQQQQDLFYLVQKDGRVNFPMVGFVKVEGLTVRELDSALVKEYEKFYEKPFVKTTVVNRRVFVFLGQVATVVPLDNEDMTIIEAIARAGGMNDDTKAEKVRLIRGDHSNPYVEVIDLTTIQGYQTATMQVRSEDIIYVEPVRRVANEAIRDVTPLLTFATSLLAIALLIASINQ